MRIRRFATAAIMGAAFAVTMFLSADTASACHRKKVRTCGYAYAPAHAGHCYGHGGYAASPAGYGYGYATPAVARPTGPFRGWGGGPANFGGGYGPGWGGYGGSGIGIGIGGGGFGPGYGGFGPGYGGALMPPY